MKPYLSIFSRFLAACAFSFFLAACGGPPPPPPAYPAASEVVVASRLGPVPSNRVRIFVFSGMTRHGKTGEQILHPFPAYIVVNDVRIGSLTISQVMVFDVTPGQYIFAWRMFDRSPALLEKVVPLSRTLPGGTTVMLRNDLTGSEYLMVPVTGEPFLIDNNQRISPDFEVVRPANCPQAFCP